MPKGTKGSTPPCSVDGCERLSDAKGRCGAHYMRWRRTGETGPPLTGPALTREKRVVPAAVDGLVRIPLTRGQWAVIDEADWPLIGSDTWHAHRGFNTWYAVSSSRRTEVYGPWSYMHRVILGLTDPNVFADHRDGDGLNNRRSNLRPATKSQNAANARAQAGGSSRYKGVSWDVASGRWQVHIYLDGRSVALGRFANEVSAARAYNVAATAAWGEFALLNPVKR